MKFETWLVPTFANEEKSSVATAAVIDVLRATTVATTALAAGAEKILTCRSVEQARDWREGDAAARPRLLCGERQCRPIDGFDLGNSPGDYSPALVAGRQLVMTTTNGTAAIEAAANAEHVILACFANLSAVVEALIQRDQDVGKDHVTRLICSGTDGAVTIEDVLCAGAILAMCHRQLSDSPRFFDGPIELIDDASGIALAVWQHSLTHENVSDAETLAARLSTTQGGRNLIAAGYESDLRDCASIDVFQTVPTRIERSPATFIRSDIRPSG
ncbi:MAG: 2-phosphosulfolactate phosphatase [Planctomycetota bacterium]